MNAIENEVFTPEFCFFENAFEGIYLVDRGRCVTDWNRAAELISGYDREQVLGQRCSENFLTHVDEKGNELCSQHCPLQATIGDGKSREARVYLRHKLGYRVPVLVRTVAIRNRAGEITGASELFTPITSCEEVMSRAAELEKLAFLDRLTSLPNRAFAESRLNLLMSQFAKTNLCFSACLIDLDHFKSINDTYGHPAGDAVLKAVALSFANGLRATDLASRWGGDEFLVLLASADPVRLRGLAERCRILVAGTVACQVTRQIAITASIGATVARPQEDLATLLARVDRNLYESKRTGRNRVTIDS